MYGVFVVECVGVGGAVWVGCGMVFLGIWAFYFCGFLEIGWGMVLLVGCD